LNVFFTKDKVKSTGSRFFIVSKRTDRKLLIKGELFIYLDDGEVLDFDRCYDSDYIDSTAVALYYLQDEDLDKLKNSRINTVKYSLETEESKPDSIKALVSDNYSASNKGTLTKTIVAEFFSE
jgi:hypothetical protein